MSQSLAKIPSDAQMPVPVAEGGTTMVKQSSRQTRHLAQAIQLEESGTAPLIRFAMMIASGACLLFVLWAGLTRVDEMAAADGQVIPSGSIVTVQHLEGGLIEQIMVKEGELVDKDQPLVRLSAAASLSDLEQSRAREAALLIKAERLRAFAEGRKPDYSTVGPGYDRLIADNQAIYQTQVQAAETEGAVLKSQVEQKRSDLDLLEQQRKTLEDQVEALSEELKLRESLVEQHLVTRVQYLDTKREQARMRGELSKTLGQTVTARDALGEAEDRLLDHTSTLHKQTMDDLSTVIGELAQVQESIGRLEDRVNRLVVLAPARGYVKGMAVHNVGAVIQPGGLVCEIVPTGRELKIDAKVSTRDIGHLKPGQRVKVKVGTYDYARYGAVMGTLERLSASSFLDEKGNPYFKATITLDQDYVGDVAGRYPITPGMTVTAEIITGDKTLLQYMLKPIFTQMTSSFHER
jgi:HlyD family secretion protein/adhesin transport system membrane fusion protein